MGTRKGFRPAKAIAPRTLRQREVKSSRSKLNERLEDVRGHREKSQSQKNRGYGASRADSCVSSDGHSAEVDFYYIVNLEFSIEIVDVLLNYKLKIKNAKCDEAQPESCINLVAALEPQ